MSLESQDSGTAAVAPGEAPTGGPADLEDEVVALRRRVAELEQQPPARHGVRQTFTVILAALTVVMLVATAAAWWASRTALDTDRFMGLVDPVLTAPEVADAVSVRVTDEVLTALDLQQRLETRLTQLQEEGGAALADASGLTAEQRARIQSLPLPDLSGLAAPIASGLEARIATRIDQLVTSPEFAGLLVSGTELAHTKAVALLRGDLDQLPNVEVAAGEVRLNLVPVVASVMEDLVDDGLAALGIEEIPFIDPFADPAVSLQRLESALGTDLPADFGQLTVMSEAELGELQAVTRMADRLVWVLLLASLLLLAATIAVAPRRRRALVQVSLATAALTVAAMALLRSTTDEVASLAVNPEGATALRVITDTVLDSLRGTMLVLLVIALIVAAAAHLLGRPAWATRTAAAWRRITEPKPGGSDLQVFVHSYHDAIRVGLIAVAALLVLFAGLTFWSVLVAAALIFAAVWLPALRGRQGPPTADGSSTKPTLKPRDTLVPH